MSFKDTFNGEFSEIKDNKKPYETVAFILFMLLILQQLFYLVKSLADFIFNPLIGFVSTGQWANSNLMGFVGRIININSDHWFFILLGLLAYLLYYVFIYIFVWNYSKKNGLAKWTWTLFVVFGPTIFLAPSYIWFVIYVFRPYLARFAKRFVSEFKAFNPNKPMPEEGVEETKTEE